MKLISPINDETITNMEPKLRWYLELPEHERREFLKEEENRSVLNSVRAAKPFLFTWEVESDDGDEFEVLISEKEDFSSPSSALILPYSRSGNRYQAGVVNLLIGKTYFWKVKRRSAGGATDFSDMARFKTEAYPPRVMFIPHVKNIRDLGGRKGLDGRMIRQGLLIRSQGLNDDTPHGKLIAAKIKRGEEFDLSKYDIGKTRLTDEGTDYINRVLQWKTDLDLRAIHQRGPINESPLGSQVQLVLYPSSAYAGIFGENGQCVGEACEAVAKSFRLLCDINNYPVVFHCAGGADRGGSLAFILKGILGVGLDELSKDWEITSLIKNIFTHKERGFDDMVAGFDQFAEPDAPLYKKIEGYLYKIGITQTEIELFQSIMLEPAHVHSE